MISLHKNYYLALYKGSRESLYNVLLGYSSTNALLSLWKGEVI